MRANTSIVALSAPALKNLMSGLPADAPQGQSDGNILLNKALDSRPPSYNACHAPCGPLTWQPGSPLSAELTFGWGSGQNSGRVCLTFDWNGLNLCWNGQNVACCGGDHL